MAKNNNKTEELLEKLVQEAKKNNDSKETPIENRKLYSAGETFGYVLIMFFIPFLVSKCWTINWEKDPIEIPRYFLITAIVLISLMAFLALRNPFKKEEKDIS